MKRSRIIALVLVVLAVVAFDVWFFFGSDDAGPVVAGVEVEEWGEDDSEPTEEADTETETATPHEMEWTRVFPKREPLDGRIRDRLMNRRGAKRAEVRIQRPAPPTFDLSAILWDDVEPTALIQSRVVREGETIGGYVVTRIEPQRVHMISAEAPDWEHTLRLSPQVREAGETAVEEQEEVPL